MPLTSHVRVVPGATHSVAVKTCVPPGLTFAEDGAIEFAAAQETVTLADADFDGSATLVATTVTELLGGIAGAVYVAVSGPVALSMPLLGSFPLVPLTVQLTVEFPPPLTVAVKFWVPPGGTFAALGTMLTVIPLWS